MTIHQLLDQPESSNPFSEYLTAVNAQLRNIKVPENATFQPTKSFIPKTFEELRYFQPIEDAFENVIRSVYACKGKGTPVDRGRDLQMALKRELHIGKHQSAHLAHQIIQIARTAKQEILGRGI